MPLVTAACIVAVALLLSVELTSKLGFEVSRWLVAALAFAVMAAIGDAVDRSVPRRRTRLRAATWVCIACVIGCVASLVVFAYVSVEPVLSSASAVVLR